MAKKLKIFPRNIS